MKKRTLSDSLMQNPRYRFTGHETFACRYAWLPKVAWAVLENESLLSSAKEDDAMVELGLGKNMVRSSRFWAESMNILRPSPDGFEPTDLAHRIFLGRYDEITDERLEPLDPYLEDVQTLWLLHWKLATNMNSLIFAWDLLLNRFQQPELYTSAVVRALSKTPECTSVSAGSLEQMWDVFLHSYVPTRGRKGEVREDNLDCPLVELGLLIPTGGAHISDKSGRAEPKYAFRRDEKPEISDELFAYCLYEYAENHHPGEDSVPLHLIANGNGSPGQVFKIPEMYILNRLFMIHESSCGHFSFEESAAIPRVVRNLAIAPPSLEAVYTEEITYV